MSFAKKICAFLLIGMFLSFSAGAQATRPLIVPADATSATSTVGPSISVITAAEIKSAAGFRSWASYFVGESKSVLGYPPYGQYMTVTINSDSTITFRPPGFSPWNNNVVTYPAPVLLAESPNVYINGYSLGCSAYSSGLSWYAKAAPILTSPTDQTPSGWQLINVVGATPCTNPIEGR